LIEMVDPRTDLGCKLRYEMLDIMSDPVPVVAVAIIISKVLRGNNMTFQRPTKFGPHLGISRKTGDEFAAFAFLAQLIKTLWIWSDALLEIYGDRLQNSSLVS
jgi:hypothetical protein